MQRVTIMDVAAKAGVSHATVERVLKGKGYISEQATKQVQAAIKELGYVPNKLASGLKNQKSGLICHLGILSGNQVFERLSFSLSQHLNSQGYMVMNIPILYQQNHSAHFLTELDQIPFEGLITSSMFKLDQKTLKRFRESSTPLVMIERGLNEPNIDEVVFDDYGGVRQAVQYLADCQCHRIAYVGIVLSGKHKHPLLTTEEKRLQGYRDAVHDLGMDPVVEAVKDYQLLCGYDAAKKLFARYPDVDGVYAASDMLLSGIMQYVESHQAEAKKRIRFVGTDNSIARYMAAPVPSLEFDYDDAADKAAKLLISKIQDPTRPREIVKLSAALNVNKGRE